MDELDNDIRSGCYHDGNLPTPPPTPPQIKFFPPLYLQRRSIVHQLLRNYSVKTQAIHSLLDVGCGTDMELLTSLIPCDDKLPLAVLTGLDLDKEVWTIGERNLFAREDFTARWRDLTVSLLFGSFARISAGSLGKYDAITACEVVEHLDPGPLKSFLPVLLGRMKPNILIVTTPNRDFNRLFEMPISPIPKKDGQSVYDPFTDPQAACRRHYRAPHEYAMRHHDHRFEFTRREFKDWANKGAKKHGYSVRFFGCGNLEEGAYFQGKDWLINEAVQRELKLGAGHYPKKSLSGAIREAFGDCTQIAAFVRLNDAKTDVHYDKYLKMPRPPSKIPNLHLNGLQFVKQRFFSEEDQSLQWPPQIQDLVQFLEDPMKFAMPISAIEAWRSDWNDILTGSNPDPDSKKVVIHTNSRFIWENSDRLQSRCRYHYKVFLQAVLDAAQCIEKENTHIFTRNLNEGRKIFDFDLEEHNSKITMSFARDKTVELWDYCAVKYNFQKTWDLEQLTLNQQDKSETDSQASDMDESSSTEDSSLASEDVETAEVYHDGQCSDYATDLQENLAGSSIYLSSATSPENNNCFSTKERSDISGSDEIRSIKSTLKETPNKILATPVVVDFNIQEHKKSSASKESSTKQRRSRVPDHSERGFYQKAFPIIKTHQQLSDPMKDVKCQISWSLDVDSSVTASHFPCDDDLLTKSSTMYYSTKARYSRNPFCDLNDNYVLPMTIVFWKPELSDEYIWHWRVEQGVKMNMKHNKCSSAEDIIQPTWTDDDGKDEPKIVGDDGW